MEKLIGLLTLVGIPTIIVALIYIGRKLQVLDDLQITVNKIKSNLQAVSTYLTRHHTKFNANELKALSPLRLTDEGNRFIQSSGFAAVFSEHKDEFLNFIISEEPKLKYDVEAAAIKSVYAMYEEPFMAFLKTWFYNNPDRNLDNTAPTLGVYIRDKYLAEHSEIAV